MTTTLNPSVNTNGRSRKSLADQIDRLDQILDGLADGLNEAVASAVKQAVAVAVQEAVRGILAEVLTNPDLLAKLRSNIGLTTPADRTPAPTRGSGGTHVDGREDHRHDRCVVRRGLACRLPLVRCRDRQDR